MIEISHLTKRFGSVLAVDDLSFTVTPGRVTGFLGPNGAGKTTTLRALLGLVRPDGGTATVDSRPYARLRAPMRTVGAALEASDFHPGRSALDHLRVLAPVVGVPDARCQEVLGLVGLDQVAGRRVGGYSMGMRQRLALATALLGDPGVLVLDEPANGLDPEGIAWLRTLLRHLAGQGRTVLISSHLLSEVQQSVDDVVIVSHGRLVHASSLAELAALSDHHVVVASPDAARLGDLLTSRGWAPAPADGGAWVVRGAGAEAIGAAAFAAGLELHQLATHAEGLEATFLRLTGNGIGAGHAPGHPADVGGQTADLGGQPAHIGKQSTDIGAQPTGVGGRPAGPVPGHSPGTASPYGPHDHPADRREHHDDHEGRHRR